MANLTESSLWEPGIYQWENTDPIEGGANGIDNVPTRQLANRTRWLRDRVVLDNEPKTITSLHTFAGGLATGLIHRGTVDGADNGALFISGGGAPGADRGGYIGLFGNEYGGDGGNVSLYAGRGGRLRFWAHDGTTDQERLTVANSGVLRLSAGRAQLGGSALPGSGYGVEIGHNGTQGTIESFDRSAQQWKSLYMNASQIEIRTQGTGNLHLDPGGATVMGATYLNTTGANPGDVVLQNQRFIRAVNAAGNATLPLIGLNNVNQAVISQPLYMDNNITLQGSLRMATSVVAGASTGDIVMANGASVRGVNVAGTGALSMMSMGPSNEVRLGTGGSVVAVGSIASGSLATSGAGDLVLANGASLRAVNAAGNMPSPLISRDAANAVGVGWNIDYGVPAMKLKGVGVGLGETGLQIFAATGNSTPGLLPVTMGAMNSGGTGYRILVIPNG